MKPIQVLCAWCRKRQTETGWQEIDPVEYEALHIVAANSARVSHGICSECEIKCFGDEDTEQQ